MIEVPENVFDDFMLSLKGNCTSIRMGSHSSYLRNGEEISSAHYGEYRIFKIAKHIRVS